MASPKPERSSPLCSVESPLQDSSFSTMPSPKSKPSSPMSSAESPSKTMASPKTERSSPSCSIESPLQDSSFSTMASLKSKPSSALCSTETPLKDSSFSTMPSPKSEPSSPVSSVESPLRDSNFVDISNCEPVVHTYPDASSSAKIMQLDHNDPLVPESSKASYHDDTILLDMLVTPTTSRDINVSRNSSKRLRTEEILSQWNFIKILSQLGTQYQCVRFAEERGLLPKEKICSRHKKPMRLKGDGVGSFKCFKRSCRERASVSRTTGTFFENSHLSIVVIFQLMYLFSHGFTHEQAIRETASVERGTTLSTSTVVCWYNSCREAIITYEMGHQNAKGKIGGLNKVVRIDQSKFGKRTHKKGKKIEGQWVIGMVEDGSDELRLDVCPGNEICEENLVPVIKKHIETGSVIHTKILKPYSCLSEHGYVLWRKMNESNGHDEQIDVTPYETGNEIICLEDQWARLGKAYKQNPHVKNFADWMVEYMWRYKVKIQHKDPFEELLNAVKYVYNS